MVHGDCYVTIIIYLHRSPAYPSLWNSVCYIMITVNCGSTSTILYFLQVYYRRKQSCGKVMFFHLSVILFRGLYPGSLCPGVSVWESLSRRVSVQGVSVQGSLSRSLCPGGSLSRELSVQGVFLSRVLCPGVGLCL